jgi:hypothetical protein
MDFVPCVPIAGPAVTSQPEAGQAGRVVVKPMDMVRAGMTGTVLPALPGTSRGRGATVGRDVADRQRFAAVLDDGVLLGGVHALWGGRVGGEGQGRAAGKGSNWRRGGAVATGC